MPSFFGIMIARQRSGTGALGTVLDKHPELSYTGEVFHPNNIGAKKNFFTFKKEKISEDIDYFQPSKGLDLFHKFYDDLLDRSGCPVFDIKYNSLHHLNGDWLHPVDRPLIIEYCIQNQLPIIHLTRRNYLQGFVSGRLAEANRVWHARSTDEISVTDIELEVGNLVDAFRRIQQNVDLVRTWLGRRHFVCEVEYSEIFDAQGYLTEACCENLQDIFDVGEFTDRSPVFVKQNKASLQESIRNFEEVQSVLSATEFAWMTEDE